MTTSEDVSKVGSPEHVDLLKENMSRVDELSKRLAQAVALKEPHNPGLDGPNQELFARAATAYWAEMWQNPARLMEQQAAYWGQTMANFAEAQNAFLRQQSQIGVFPTVCGRAILILDISSNSI